MSESRLGIGQHRSTPGLSGNNGQRERRDPAAVVGPNLSGGEMQNTVPGSQPINSGVPVHGAAENDYDRACRHGKR